MKDKRTYTNQKEHGEDMSYENEIKTPEDRGALDLTYLIEMHKKEIWEWKQKEADWIKTDNLLNGSKKIIDELSAKLVDQVRVIAELRYDINIHKKEIKKLLAEKNK
jgi:hypothetical protein|tara:strand:- start:958 stop:1278 length:321 start_codon:yes stop_codon:yes gene_type:complete